MIGLTAAVIILLLAFGTATAMAMPIVSAVLGLACALSIIRLLQNVIEVPSVAATLATMIGLGVGIDYALFIVTRHKQQLSDGMEVDESVARATATSGGAVVFAGFTVVIALCSLGVAGIPLVTALGFTAAVAVVVAVLAATTLLPAMLGALGPRINSLRVQLGRTHPDDHQPHGWLRWAEGVSRRPWPAVIVAVADPGRPRAAGPQPRAGPVRTTARCRSPPRCASPTTAITKGFGVGTNGPLLVAVSARQAAASPTRSSSTRSTAKQQQLKLSSSRSPPRARPPGCPQQRGAAAGAAADRLAAAEARPADKKQASNPATDPRADQAREADLEDARRAVGLAADPRQDGHSSRLHGDREVVALVGRAPWTWSTTCATT